MKFYKYKDIKDYNPYSPLDWKHYFFMYMVTREGFLLNVYKDIYGYYTVGIGHLIVAADGIPKSNGYMITKEKVVELFLADFDRLRVEQYTSEIYKANPFKKIGLASFIWAHGYGDYHGGQTRQLLKTSDNEQTIRAKIATWDKAKPANQVRNKADFDMFFSGISKHASGLLDFSKVFKVITDNPAASGTAAALLFFFCS